MSNTVAPHIIQSIRAEYLEMPGLSLRPEQVQRLCGVDSTLCESVLEALVDSGFLSRVPMGLTAATGTQMFPAPDRRRRRWDQAC